MDLEQRLHEGPLKIRDVWSADKTAQLPAKVVRLRRRRSLARAALVASAGLCVFGAFVLGSGSRSDGERPQTAAALQAAATRRAQAPQQVVVLRDGSRAEPADAQSRFTILRDRADLVSVRLLRGAARFDVVKNPERQFEVESGPVRIRVKGTIFAVTRTSTGERVAVEDGRVQVSWAGEQVELAAGESGVFPPPAQRAELEARRRREPPAVNASGWRDLAKRGEFKKAYSALRHARTRVQDLPEDHMLAADVARLSGHPQQAVPHLRAVSERFRDDPRAPVAAFTLGRVLLHDLDAPRDAAAAFRRARALWPRGPLALDAWASEAEALDAAGDARAAAKLAAGYLERHPDGRHVRSMRSLAALD